MLAFRFATPSRSGACSDWVLSFVFYAAIALVIMVWLWPMTRDLRQLERSTAASAIATGCSMRASRTRSPVYPLAEAFRRMAARIDGLIGSHKDMSNALSHEIKTPLARMRFEIELARAAADRRCCCGISTTSNADVAELDAFVTATLDYAVLERAEVALNVADARLHARSCPLSTESVKRGARADLDDPVRSGTATRRQSCATRTSWRRCCATCSTTRFGTRRSQVRVTFAIVARQRYRLVRRRRRARHSPKRIASACSIRSCSSTADRREDGLRPRARDRQAHRRMARRHGARRALDARWRALRRRLVRARAAAALDRRPQHERGSMDAILAERRALSARRGRAQGRLLRAAVLPLRSGIEPRLVELARLVRHVLLAAVSTDVRAGRTTRSVRKSPRAHACGSGQSLDRELVLGVG